MNETETVGWDDVIESIRKLSEELDELEQVLSGIAKNDCGAGEMPGLGKKRL